MNKFLILVAAAAITSLTAPARAQSVGEKTGVNSVLGIAPSTKDFIKEAAMSDMFEIQSSQLAQEKSTTPETKAYAAKMVTDHQKTTSELKSMVQGKGEIPNKLNSSLQGKLDKLKGLNGDEFTKQYDSIQESAHEDAVSLFKRYADSGKDTQLKNWAGKTLPTLEHHLDMAKSLED